MSEVVTRETTAGLRRVKPYPAYKDSGVEWLGEIPAHWEVVRSKRLFKLRNVRALEGDSQLTASQQYGVIPQADFMAKQGRRVVQVITGADILKHVEASDFVISMRSFQGGIEWSPYAGAISSAYVVLAPSRDVWHPYFVHLLKSRRYVQALQSTSDLVRDGQALRFENFTEVDLPSVPMGEQRVIAALLDRETARIDTLVAKKERLIELLQEKRIALITRAVTKGLDPNVPMKDSGVEWLGEIPAHWSAKKLKAVSIRVTKGTTPTTLGHDFVDEGIRFVKIESISDTFSVMPESCAFITPEADALLSRSQLREGDVLVGIAGAIGRIGLVDRGLLPANTNQAVGIVHLNDQMLPRWVAYSLASDFAQEQLGLDQVQSAQANLSLGDLSNTWLPVPPSAEQCAIAAFLDRETAMIDALVAKVRSAIDHLNEFRTALISAAVTGKIDVRQESTSTA